MVEVMNRPAEHSDLDAVVAGTLLAMHNGSEVTDASRFVSSYISPLAPNPSASAKIWSALVSTYIQTPGSTVRVNFGCKK
jgi:hypothetical protein